MSPDVDVDLNLKRVDENNDDFERETSVKIETWPSFEEICDLE